MSVKKLREEIEKECAIYFDPDNKGIDILFCDIDGTLTNGTNYFDKDGLAMKGFNTHDAMGFELLYQKRPEITVIFISSATSVINTRRALSFSHHRLRLRQSADLDALHCNKKQYVKRFRDAGFKLAYIGDDVNDIGAMSYSHIVACPSDATTPIVQFIYSEKKDNIGYRLSKRGGEGCVREFIDEVLLTRLDEELLSKCYEKRV